MPSAIRPRKTAPRASAAKPKFSANAATVLKTKILALKPAVLKSGAGPPKVLGAKAKVAISAAMLKAGSVNGESAEIAPAKPNPQDLKKAFEFVSSVAGRKGLKVVKSLGDGATDETVEKQTGFKVSEVRHLLNVLHNRGIVEYTREKNMTTGWFTYTWKFNLDRSTKNFLAAKLKRHEALSAALARESTTQFYACPKGCTRLDFAEASEKEFKCACGKKLAFQDNAKRLVELKDELEAIRGLLANSNAKL